MGRIKEGLSSATFLILFGVVAGWRPIYHRSSFLMKVLDFAIQISTLLAHK
jgi:hypothetical protein